MSPCHGVKILRAGQLCTTNQANVSNSKLAELQLPFVHRAKDLARRRDSRLVSPSEWRSRGGDERFPRKKQRNCNHSCRHSLFGSIVNGTTMTGEWFRFMKLLEGLGPSRTVSRAAAARQDCSHQRPPPPLLSKTRAALSPSRSGAS